MKSPLTRDYIHGDSINQFVTQGDDLRDHLEYKQAIDKYRSILKNTTSNSPEYIYLLNQIVFCGLSLDQFSLVQEEYKVLSGLADLRAEPAFDYQINSGLLLKSQGRYMKSKEVLLSALKQTNNLNKRMVINEHLSEVYFQLNGVIDSTYHYLKGAFEISESYHNGKTVWYDLSLKMIEQHIIRRDYIAGLAFLEDVLNASYEQNSKYVSLALALKGKIHRKNEEPEKAKLAYEESLDLTRVIENPEVLGKVFQELMVFHSSNKDSASFFSIKREFESLGNDSEITAIADFSTGFYYFNLQLFHKSARYFESYLSRIIKTGKPDHVVEMQALNLLVICKKKIGSFEDAEQLIRKVIAFNSHLYRYQPEFDSLFAPEIINKKYNFLAFSDLGNHYLEAYKRDVSQIDLLKRAFKIYKALDDVIPEQLTMSEEDAFLELVGQAGNIYADATETAFHLMKLESNDEVLNWSGRFMERGRGLRLLSQVTKDLNEIEQIPDSLLLVEKTQYARMANYKMLRQTGVNVALNMKRLIQKQENLSEYLRNQYPNYYKLKYNRNIPTPEAIRSVLVERIGAPDGVIGYQMSDSTQLFIQAYGAWGTRLTRINLDSSFHKALTIYRDHFDQETLALDIRAFDAFTNAAHILYSKLVAPWRGWFAEGSDNFIVVADGVLGEISFEALLKSEVKSKKVDYRLNYLVNDINFTFALSVKGFVEHYSQVVRNDSFTSVLGYAYSSHKSLNERGRYLEELEGTVNELNTLEELSHSSLSTFRYGNQATKQRFLSDIKMPFDVVHLGMHASSSSLVKEDNKILFRHSSPSKAPTALFGFELVMNPIRARLAVLSACDSGKGAIVKGGGTYSLVRSFMMAGVSEVIASRWTLPDRSGSEIMGYFYQGLLKDKKKPDEALHQAKLSYLSNASKYGARPFFWAGLTLSKN